MTREKLYSLPWAERVAMFSRGGYPESWALADPHEQVRLHVWSSIGFAEDAKTDQHWLVRLGFYLWGGDWDEALKDSDSDIRKIAQKHIEYRI